MNKKLENYTKGELITLLESKKKIDSKKEGQKQQSPTLLDIILKFKVYILSLSIIAVLTKTFKNYKSIRAILKFANYIIVTMFGISIFEAFGFGFLVKLLGELKYIFGSIVAYLTDSTFYNYLTKIFTVVEEKESVRGTYKKPKDIDWKAEYEKAERQREIDKWKEKYEHHKDNDNNISLKTIGITILLLGGTIAVWYYGKEALDVISPLHSLSDIIKRVLRGGRDDDDNNDNNNDDNNDITPTFNTIELDPEVRNISPEMLVYSSDPLDDIPQAPPAPPYNPPAHPIPSTEQGPPAEDRSSMLELIKKGRKLKPAVTVVKDGLVKGVIKGETNVEAGSSKITFETKSKPSSLADALARQFEKIRPVMSDDQPEIDESKDWDGETTPTNLNKGNLEESPRSDKAELGIIEENLSTKNKKQKFLDSISHDSQNNSSSSKISPALKPIMENFPNLSKQTLEKLSTVEGFKNRNEILNELSDEEFSLIDKELKKPFSEMEDDEIAKIKLDKIIVETMQEDSETVIERLEKEIPGYDTKGYRERFMKYVEQEINSGKTEEEREHIKKSFLKYDLLERQQTGGEPSARSIRNMVRENYTHNSLLNEIKNKASKISLKGKQKAEDDQTDHYNNTMNLFEED